MAKIDLVALLAETEAEETAAKAVELSEEQKAAHVLLERRAQAREARAAALKAAREVDGGLREAAARTAAGGRYLVRAIDLVDFFPFGEAPSGDRLPTGGVIIVRSPLPEKQAAVSREMEAKKRPVEDILRDPVIESTVDPVPPALKDPAPADVENAALLSAFFGAYPGAGANAGNIVLELGGLRQKADKRGRS